MPEFAKDIYAKGLAAGMAVFLGGCATPLKGETGANSVKNPPESSQPEVPFVAGKCVKFSVELGLNQAADIASADPTDPENSYRAVNAGPKLPKDNPKGQTAENTVKFVHRYNGNGGRVTSNEYIYDYSERGIKYENHDSARVSVVKVEDGRVGVIGWVCQ